ncbi:hypothetical protein [Deinococcus sp. NW-56]|uniref:hypothetical protein n=1 Tax=Deinococcus sp. NW-56 TaxID=2080419 RepID=UPI00131A2749|nr:hypothetical protein [Deinococcus sp. NW-56]
MRRGLLLGGVALLSVAFAVWGFAGSSFSTGAAVAGALGAALLGLAVFFRVRRGATGWGVTAVVGTQFLYLALWTLGGLLLAGPPRELPRFASLSGLALEDVQGRWTREDGRAYELRGTFLCPVRQPGRPYAVAPTGPCLRLMPEHRGFSLLLDDVTLPLRTSRRWGREEMDAGMFGLTFSRSIPNR